MANKLTIILTIFLNLFFLNLSFAQVIDSSFYNWTVYEMQNDEFEDKQCYIISHPIKYQSNQANRQRPYLMITRFQRQRSEEVSIFSGFEYKIGSKIFIMVDDSEFYLATKSDLAWAKNRSEDIEIIQKMLTAQKVKVRSDSAISTFAIDEYSMKGISRAYGRMRDICER
jgi:hypothetical protein